jgi:hypothetical protein
MACCEALWAALRVDGYKHPFFKTIAFVLRVVLSHMPWNGGSKGWVCAVCTHETSQRVYVLPETGIAALQHVCG